MRKIILFIFLLMTFMGNVIAHGLSVHIAQFDQIKQYLLDKYGPDYSYYYLMENYPEYVKFGMTLPDMVYVNAGRDALKNLYTSIDAAGGFTADVRKIDLSEVPDPNDPSIGTLSFGIDTHDYRYAMQFAQYLLDQAILEDPLGIDPGGIGLDSQSRKQKLALAFGYLIHMMQDMSAHNYWVPKKTAEADLGELSMLESKDPGTQLDVIPGIQSHYAIETMHEYRMGKNVNQAVVDNVCNGFYVVCGNSTMNVQVLDGVTFVGQKDPEWGPAVYTAPNPEIYEGLNPALHFFYKVLEDWYNNNPKQLTVWKTEGVPLISLKGFVEEAHMWRFANKFFPEIVGYGDFSAAFSDWIYNHMEANTELSEINVWTSGYVDNNMKEFLKNIVVHKLLVPVIDRQISSVFQPFIGIMNNDPAKAEQMANDPTSIINYSEYQRLKSSPVFTNAHFFDDYTFYENMQLKYIDVIGPDGKLYSDWAPEYYHTYFWGVLNSLNGDSQQFERRSDIGVYDSWFTVNGQRFGPGVDALKFEPGNSFTAEAELYAMENMTSPVTVTAKVKLDHNSNSSALDRLIKTTIFTIQQDPNEYDTVDRKKVSIPFTSADMSGLNLDDYKGAYLELSVIPNRPFYSTDWYPYSQLASAQNKRYEKYSTYSYAPFAYPNGYLFFRFVNMNDDNVNIGSTININGTDYNSDEPVSIFHNEDVTATAHNLITYNSDTYKNHHWNQDLQETKLEKIFNAASDQPYEQDLYYKNFNDVTITSSEVNSGQFSIKDPWYVEPSGSNQGKRMNAYHQLQDDPAYSNNNVYQGVFLGQGIDGYGNWAAPYYSVKASASQTATAHGETVSYAFDRWGGTGVQYQSPDNRETPVVFSSAGAVAEARYKGHLASNTATATGPNGSRVIARSRIKYDGYLYGSGKKYIYFMAYADGGEIWYSKAETDDQTTNGTFNWLTETKVSDSQGGNYNPSVATLGNVVYFTWAQKIGNTWYLRFRYYNNNNNSYYWSPTQTIATFSSTTTPTPQIALTENPVRVMVASNVNGNVKSWLRKNGSWQYAGLNVSGSQPALCADEVTPDLDPATHYFGDIALVYTYNNDIYLRNWNTSNESWSAAKKVSVQNIFSIGNQHASVTYWDGEAYIAWRAYNDEIGSNSIYERSWYPNAFSSQTTVIEDPDDSFEASVSKNSSLIVAYRNGGTVYKAKRYGGWTRTTIGSGRYPSITPHYNETLVYNKYNSAPFLIKHHYEAPAGGGGFTFKSSVNTDTTIRLVASRRLIYGFGDAALSVDIANARFGARALTWHRDNHSDTLKAVGSGELTLDVSALQKNAFAADQPNTTLFNIYFVSGGEETLLRAFRLNDLKPTATDQRQGGTRHLILATRRVRDGYFRIGLAGNSPREYTVLHASGIMAPLAKATEAEGSALALPVTYSLGQNYPNPFNPVTHIRFALPQAGAATLTVYDMTGRVVSTLVNGYKAAGRYDVTFDGTNLASGAYVYRLQAGNNFVETKKLLLVK